MSPFFGVALLQCSHPEVGILVDGGLCGGDLEVDVYLSADGEAVGLAAVGAEASNLVKDVYVVLGEYHVVLIGRRWICTAVGGVGDTVVADFVHYL